MLKKITTLLFSYLDVLFAFICFWILVAFVHETKSVFGGADTYQHLLISKESFTNPSLFLHHWGKPVFILLSAPFAQFGLVGIKIFNALVICLTAVGCSRILKVFKVKTNALVVPLIVSLPIAFQTVFSALTEPLFSLFLVLSILLFAKNKIRAALIVISFIPLIRNEGFIFLPLFFMALIGVKRLKDSYLLLTGTLIYSVLGFFFLEEGFLWLFTSNPYTGNSYGVHGDLLHYIYQLPNLVGSIMAWASVLIIPFAVWKLITLTDKKLKISLALLTLTLLGYLAAHSYVWWKGMSGSLGFLRIMMPITPFIAIFMLLILDATLKKIRLLNWIISFAFIAVVIGSTDFNPLIPKTLNEEEKGLIETADFLKTQAPYHKLMHYNPALCYFTGRELFNYETSIWLSYGFKDFGHNNIVCWDSHFGAQEGGTPVNQLLFNKKLELLAEIIPDTNKVFNSETYKIFVFRSDSNEVNDFLVDEVHMNFEPNQKDSSDLTSENTTHELNPEHRFFEIYSNEILSAEKYANVFCNIDVLSSQSAEGSIIISVEDSTGIVHYFAKKIEELENWQNITFEKMFSLNNMTGKAKIKVYVWCKGSNKMEVDNIKTYVTKIVVKNSTNN